MRTIVLPCTAGCGRTKTVTVQDLNPFDQNTLWTCAIDTPGFKTPAEEEADRQAKAQADFDARVFAAMQKIKATDPELSILVDDDANPVTPPILKRIWNFIFK